MRIFRNFCWPYTWTFDIQCVENCQKHYKLRHDTLVGRSGVMNAQIMAWFNVWKSGVSPPQQPSITTPFPVEDKILAEMWCKH